MSKQAKKREINKYRIRISRYKKELKFYETLLNVNKKEIEDLKRDLEFKEALIGVYEDGNKKIDKAIEIYKVKINKLQRENEQLKAENYSLKNRGFFKRLLGA